MKYKNFEKNYKTYTSIIKKGAQQSKAKADIKEIKAKEKINIEEEKTSKLINP